MFLKLLKEHKPVEVSEFPQAINISDKTDFCLWVLYKLIKRDRIIAAVYARVFCSTHKYGIEVPTSVDHPKRLDASNGNRFLQEAIDKYMISVAVAFEILDEGKLAPVGWIKASVNLVFDVNMDFIRKARWFKDGHRTADPEHFTFAGVVL